MINPFTQINWAPSDTEIKKFGKTLLIGFVLISILIAVISYFRSGIAWSPVLILSGIGVLVFALTSTAPKLSLPLYYVWFFVAACMGVVISNLILAAFYYLMFTPFSTGMKIITGRDPLTLEKHTDKRTYWVNYKQKHDLKSYFKQY